MEDFTPEQTARFYEVMGHVDDIENLSKEQAVYILTGEFDTQYRDLDQELRDLQDEEAAAAERLKGVI